MRVPNSGSFKPGQRTSPETEFTSERVKGPNNYKWRGDQVGYWGVHSWVQRTLGVARRCSDCGSEKHVQWANVSREYKRLVTDWKELCAVCHRGFDGITKFTKEQVALIKREYADGSSSQRALARKFGCSQITISRIVSGRTKFYA